MEYALAESANLVYCGLSVSLFVGSPSSNYIDTLSLLHDELAKRNLPVIAPIGNDRNSGLSAPAAFAEAVSIAAACEDLGQVTLPPFGNKPMPPETITFRRIKQLFPLHARHPIPALISEASKTALAVQGAVNGVLREF